jgi:hypothetical protein
MVEKLTKTFTNKELQWCIAMLYLYVHTKPEDFPINLENVYALMGFAHKKNAKRTLENNFINDEDYKIVVLPRERALINDGENKQDILLNVDKSSLRRDTVNVDMRCSLVSVKKF